MKIKNWLFWQWSKLRRLVSGDKSRWVPLYKTGTRVQVGWHYRTDAEIARDNDSIVLLRQYFNELQNSPYNN